MATAKGVNTQEPMSFTSALLRANCPDLEEKKWIIKDYTEEELVMELSRRIFEQELRNKDTIGKISGWVDRLYEVRHRTIATRNNL
jgi:hypothetical protein